jgi:hypothetical protein
MSGKTLEDVVNERPFPEYQNWWPVGAEFTEFMSEAISSEWLALHGHTGDLARIREYTDYYLGVVYGVSGREDLVDSFGRPSSNQPIRSGEFDALSYAYYRSAFELIEGNTSAYRHDLERKRRLFTKRVGKRFFGQLHSHLALALPPDLHTETNMQTAKKCLSEVGGFLHDQGYLRSHFAFRFDVEIDHQGNHISQADVGVVGQLKDGGTAYALYEMGYPIILPSAVYLYHTMGEAQHHSSRTIEDLFAMMGYDARETDDFDPIGYPSDMVVELWEIRRI